MIIYNHSDLGYEPSRYSISYSNLREEYLKICAYSDNEFLEKLPEALHLACIICWFKEIPSGICLCDEGIIHQLTHLIHLGKEWYHKTTYVKKIRKQFKRELQLN